MKTLRHPQFRAILYCLAAWVLVLLPVGRGVSGEIDVQVHVAVMVSKHIRPYADALDGAKEALARIPGCTVKPLWLDEYPDDGHDTLGRDIVDANTRLIVTIGPEALVASNAVVRIRQIPVISTVVLNPERIVGNDGDFCGVSLKIPVASQLKTIAGALPDIERLGLLYNAQHNRVFFEEAIKEAVQSGISVVPCVVKERSELPDVLARSWPDIDALWMIPDPTVISERIVQYIIREAIYQKKAVIGFNRFFYESGAVLSFEFDYFQLGGQAGLLAKDWMASGECRVETPVYRFRLNTKVAEKIGVRVSEHPPGGDQP